MKILNTETYFRNEKLFNGFSDSFCWFLNICKFCLKFKNFEIRLENYFKSFDFHANHKQDNRTMVNLSASLKVTLCNWLWQRIFITFKFAIWTNLVFKLY